MPKADLNHPPPAKPAMDRAVQSLQTIVQAMNMEQAARKEGKPSPFSEAYKAAFAAVQSPIVAKMAAQNLEARWAKYDAFPMDDLLHKKNHPGDLLYFRGDVIEVLENTSPQWALGRCRGRLGLFPVEQTVAGPFVLGLVDYWAANDAEISFKKGMVMPAIAAPGVDQYTVYNNAEYGNCPRECVAALDHKPTAEERRLQTQKYYQYSPLQPGQIRLLHITPEDVQKFVASGRQSLFVTIANEPLERIKDATALSYCWGDPADKKPIFANGKLLFVPAALWRALRWQCPDSGLSQYSLADHPEDRGDPKEQAVFWADAVCINQEDVLEKNHQIPMMGSIYSNARLALVYVGEGEVSFHTILMMKIIAEAANTVAPWEIVPDKVIREKMSRSNWNSLRDFLSEQVFRRSWVTQEIVLATKIRICYGMTWIQLHQILDGIRAIQMNHVHHIDSLVGFPTWNRDQSLQFTNGIVQLFNLDSLRTRRLEGKEVNFLEILENFRLSKATDLRDKVYSLLSLASKDYQTGIVPDYSASNTVVDVYLDLARFAINTGDIDRLLRNAGVPQTVDGLPSWVPDWNYDARQILPSDQYNCGRSDWKCHALLDPTHRDVLTIRGVVFDTITKKAPKLDTAGHGTIPDVFGTLSVSIMIVYNLMKNMGGTVGASSAKYLNGEDLLTAVWQTLVCGLGWNGKRSKPADKKHFEAFLKCYQEQLLLMQATNGAITTISVGTKIARNDAELETYLKESQIETLTKILKNETIPPLSPEQQQRALLEDEMYPFLAAMLHNQAERRTCKTEKGYVGTVAGEVEEGDVIVIFYGLRIPYVLHPLGGGTGYELVGPCYVHGIMDGEFLANNDEGSSGVQSVDFLLI